MNEQELLARAKQVHQRVKSRYKVKKGMPLIKTAKFATQGNFTVVTLNGSVVGVSKRNTQDRFNIETGVNVALNRAVHNLLQTGR